MPPLRSDGKLTAVISDMDGVLADASEALNTMSPGAWSWFHDQCEYMRKLDNGVAPLLRLMYRAGIQVIILTCRPEKYYDATTKWLDRHGILYNDCMCRPTGVHHTEWKRKAALELQKRYMLAVALDDNPAEIAMYEELGVPGLYIPSKDWGPEAPQHQWKEEQKYG